MQTLEFGIGSLAPANQDFVPGLSHGHRRPPWLRAVARQVQAPAKCLRSRDLLLVALHASKLGGDAGDLFDRTAAHTWGKES